MFYYPKQSISFIQISNLSEDLMQCEKSNSQPKSTVEKKAISK